MEPFTLQMAANHAKLPASGMPAALAYLGEVERAMDGFFARYDVPQQGKPRDPGLYLSIDRQCG